MGWFGFGSNKKINSKADSTGIGKCSGDNFLDLNESKVERTRTIKNMSHSERYALFKSELEKKRFCSLYKK